MTHIIRFTLVLIILLQNQYIRADDKLNSELIEFMSFGQNSTQADIDSIYGEPIKINLDETGKHLSYFPRNKEYVPPFRVTFNGDHVEAIRFDRSFRNIASDKQTVNWKLFEKTLKKTIFEVQNR